jgi:flagellum-specific peptidoglycan hydrolase FlgJ
MSNEDAINSILPGAVAVQLATGLPAPVLIAQTILETGYLKSVTKDMHTGANSFNLFNIKGDGPAGHVSAWTREVIDGKSVQIVADFRAYHNYQESFADYAALITGDPIYARAVAVKDNPWQYANMLQTCGYATDPSYADNLSALMRQWNLVERVKTLADQTPSDWAKDAWEKCAQAGVFDGTLPHDSMTREMLAVLLVKLGLVK